MKSHWTLQLCILFCNDLTSSKASHGIPLSISLGILKYNAPNSVQLQNDTNVSKTLQTETVPLIFRTITIYFIE
jgi:hypothetical protein